MDMTTIFEKILHMSLTAGYCIVIVIAFRFLLRKQPKIFSYLLWSVVLFRLLCPVSPVSSYSLVRLDPAMLQERAVDDRETIWQGKQYLFDESTELIADEGTAEAVAGVEETELHLTGRAQAVLVGSRIWLAGVFLLFGYSLLGVVRVRRVLSQAVLTEEGVYEAEGISTPFVFGIVCPKIYLPARIQPQERRYVLAHERVHIARRDHLVKLLAWGAVCLHWFNPLVWAAFTLAERDMEMSCDEAVLKRLGEGEKQAYSLALLQLSCEENGFFRSPVAFGEGNVRGRIQNILGWHKRGLATVAVLVVLLVVLAVGLAFDPADTAQEEAEELLRMGFVDAYANAFCERDGNTLVGMYLDEKTAYESLPMLEEAGGEYSFGFSSPWPNEFRFILSEGETEDEGRAEIWYYAWTSDPHVTVWKEEIPFNGDGLLYPVTYSELRYLDSIASRTDFDAAYLIGGEYQFTDYVERGFLDAILMQTAYDMEENGADRNAAYRDPVTAAEWILNLTGGAGEAPYSNDAQAVVHYTFADGSSVEIPMYNAGRSAAGGSFGDEERGAGAAADVWLPDLQVWNAKAP